MAHTGRFCTMRPECDHRKESIHEPLENTDELWLVPAIALQESVDDVHEESHQPSVPTKHRLECWECERETEHRFDEFESLLSADWSGQPIWECRVCGTPRYGPLPE